MRSQAIQTALSRNILKVKTDVSDIPSLYGSYVFGQEAMKEYLKKDAFKAVQDAIKKGTTIQRDIAEAVAEGMKAWALDKGATSFTHWFQPLTGLTAEKHDSFYEVWDGKAIANFSAGSLVQQEPDASSLPSGGLRNTFEARGYTAWDPSSPAFIMEKSSGKTLCIPTIFVSYHGEALDYKAPLLKTMALLSKAATDVCQYFDKKVKHVGASLGIEQEYFLIDKALHDARPDLLMTGRTVFGHASSKGQQMDDHYFGAIPARVFNFMYDLELESMKLGIPLRTRHNEVAPGQYECAPMFEEINLAVDHNQLLMDLMEEIGRKHGFKTILHEKPFAGINGSGKHNNWSLITDTGVNLLSPGTNPEDNLQFLTFFILAIKAFKEGSSLLRASIASAGNDHRLGANEAPPAIMSAFIGSSLTKLLKDFESNKLNTAKNSDKKVINVHNLPDIQVDNTDRNRTSPFAFTGNKFEFRAVGSSENCGRPMIVLNAAMADQLINFKKEVDALVSKKTGLNDAITKVLKSYLKSCQDVLFEGNGYSEEWAKEAEKRGLENIKNSVDAFESYLSKTAEQIFVKNGIFTREELHARYEIKLETYIKKIQIEGRIMDELVHTHILPSALSYKQRLADTINSMQAAGMTKDETSGTLDVLKKVTHHTTGLKNTVDKMVEARKKANDLSDTRKKAQAYCNDVKSYFDEIRKHVDKLEYLIDDDLWKLPKYRELLFIR
ncbi:MAG: glutamine synthetase III [Flavobacteriales bacterium]|nr:glutamine synthetase III [Flavobacteriales bacterium]